MTKRSIDLAEPTDPAWVGAILNDFDAFLCDHANCERKASALAMSLVVKYPDRTRMIPTLIALAQEELEHFRQVYALMERRGLQLVNDSQDPYVNQLLKLARHGREERLLDRLLVSSLVECRGAERFGILAEALDDPELTQFYRTLWAGEVKHGHQFADLAVREFGAEEVYLRLEEMAQREAEIVRALPWRAALH